MPVLAQKLFGNSRRPTATATGMALVSESAMYHSTAVRHQCRKEPDPLDFLDSAARRSCALHGRIREI